MHYVYILENPKGQHYTGCTGDLQRRLSEHLKGQSEYTSHHGPYHLIYYEACLSSKDAYARERYLKSGLGKRYVKKRLKHYKEELMNPVTTQGTARNINNFEAISSFQQSQKHLTESEL